MRWAVTVWNGGEQVLHEDWQSHRRSEKMDKQTVPTSASTALLSSDIAVGHCVIVNHVEKPCGKLLAVIVAIEEDRVRSKYLNADPILTLHNKRGVVSRRETVTPCGLFGVAVMVDESGTYWCQPVGPSQAKYDDGDIRPWQEYSCVYQYRSRPDVLAVARAG